MREQLTQRPRPRRLGEYRPPEPGEYRPRVPVGVWVVGGGILTGMLVLVVMAAALLVPRGRMQGRSRPREDPGNPPAARGKIVEGRTCEVGETVKVGDLDITLFKWWSDPGYEGRHAWGAQHRDLTIIFFDVKNTSAGKIHRWRAWEDDRMRARDEHGNQFKAAVLGSWKFTVHHQDDLRMGRYFDQKWTINPGETFKGMRLLDYCPPTSKQLIFSGRVGDQTLTWRLTR